MKIPTYERQYEVPQQKAATGQAPAPVRQAFGENVIQSVGNIGKAINELNNAFVNIQVNNDKNLLLLKTNELENDYKRFITDLNTKSDYQNFDNYKKDFIDKQINKLKNDLGENLFNKWWNIEGIKTFNSISADIDVMKIPAGIKQDNQLLKDNISALAYKYATTVNKDERAELIEKNAIKNSIEQQINNSLQNDDVKRALIKDASRQFAKSDIDYLININPVKTKHNIESGRYKGDLTAKEESDYLRKCEILIKNREGSIYDNQLEPFYTEFEDKYLTSPSLANEYYVGLQDRKRFKEAGLDTKQINKLLNDMNRALEGGSFGQSSMVLEQYNTLNKKILISNNRELAKTGEFVPIESWLGFITDSNDLLNSKNLTSNDYNKVLKNRNEIYEMMGLSIKQEQFNPTTETDTNSGIWRLWKSTNNGYLRDELKKTFTESGMLEDGNFKDISNQEVGIIYSQAYKFCNGINMGDTKDSNSELKIQEAISKALIQFVSQKYGTQAKDSADILINKHLIKLRNDVKNQTQGFTLNSYRD